MWKKLANNVNKVWGEWLDRDLFPDLSQIMVTYPQTSRERGYKYGLLEAFIDSTHIHTPNSSSNFYI